MLFHMEEFDQNFAEGSHKETIVLSFPNHAVTFPLLVASN